MDNELETRQVLALLMHLLANGGGTKAELTRLIEGLGFDSQVVARWADRRLGTGPLKPKPGVIRRSDDGDYFQQ